MPRPTLSTHVLDTGVGAPAAGVSVAVYRGDAVVASGTTDGDGRIAQLPPGGLEEGSYRIVFEVGTYFRGREAGAAFFTRVALDVELARDGGHYHVPLLVSRYGCVSYRGS
ncbi:MAG: hydroxyisourate hydrolase [Candidatus Limnocylindria bacterium]